MKKITAFSASGGSLNQGLFTQGLEPGPSLPNNQTQGAEKRCAPNISLRERLKRLIGGVIPFVFALAILAWLISTNADRIWRLPLFFLFVGSAFGFFQWRDKT